MANTDLLAIRRFLHEGRRPLRVEGNPMAQALRMTLLAVNPQDGRVTVAFEPPMQFIQGTGVLQGGAIAGMLDFAMAFATLATLGEADSCATVSMSTSLLRPAPLGRYIAHGEIERRGKTVAFTRASLLQDSDAPALVATGTSVLALRT